MGNRHTEPFAIIEEMEDFLEGGEALGWKNRMGWDAVVGPRSGSRNNVKRGLKPWKGVGDKTEQSRSFH